MLIRILVLCAGLAAVSACGRRDLDEPPVDMGNFRLGLNIAVADKAEKVPISRTASEEEWEAAITDAIQQRFGRYKGSKMYNIGISVDGYALAPPGIPVIAAPKSVLVITANVWDDAAQKKLNAEGKQITLWEDAGANILGSGLIRGRDRQMDSLAYNAAKRVEQWFQENPEWFDIQSPAPVPETGSDPVVVAAPPVEPAAAAGPSVN